MKPSPLAIAIASAFVLSAACVQATERGTASMGGGANPPTVTPEQQALALKRILGPYRPDTLNAEQVRSIRADLDRAGLKASPALDAAMAQLGFSRKRLDAVLPQASETSSSAASTPARRFPRPQ